MKNKLFYCKEPTMHTFYVDVEKNRFYKCWNNCENLKSYAENEINVYKVLEGTGTTPKLYNVIRDSDRIILELELIKAMPIWGYGKKYLPWENITYSKKQKESILNQFYNFCALISKKGLIYEKGNVTFELTQNNILYDAEKDKIYFIDFAPMVGNFEDMKKIILSHIWELPEGEGTTKNLTNEDILKYYIFPDLFRTGKFEEVWKEGEELLELIKEVGPRFVYQSLFINGKLCRGQRGFSRERFQIYDIPSEEIIDKTVLDIGCNVGGTLVYTVEQGAKKAIGIEACSTATKVAKKYISYLQKIYPALYNKIEHNQGDAVTFNYPKVDILFYFSCWRHFGSPDYHKKLGECANIIYFEGHAHYEEKEIMKKVLPQFGENFEWTYLGSCEEGIGAEQNKWRAVYKGAKKNV